MTRVVRIEKLAPTGEGIARTADGVGFIDRALPGELVETNVYQVRRKFWRGSLRAVLEPSRDRIETPHATCAGCDWAHYEPAAAREEKRRLFLETMERIGKLDARLFGEVQVAPSPPAYRLRTRLHVSSGREGAMLGYFAPGSHRVVPASDCEAVSAQTRALLPGIRQALERSGAGASELGLLEDIPGTRRLIRVSVEEDPQPVAALGRELSESFAGVRVESRDEATLLERGDWTLRLDVGGRSFSVSVDSFFQSNRHLVSELLADVETASGEAAAGDALDAFSGVGLFAGALLSAGCRVVSVESNRGAVDDARRTRELWSDGGRWEIVASGISEFLRRNDRRFECVVADPPRAGLGPELARELARRARRRLLCVSCDPATLARDLPAILREGFVVRHAKLYDLFAFTHRIESLVALERAG